MNRITNFMLTLLMASTAIASPSKMLMQSVVRGDLEGVQQALSKNADANFVAKDGTTPLWLAAYFGFDQIVWTLLRNNADALRRPEDVALHGRANSAKLNPQRWLRRKSSSESALPLPKRASVMLSGSLIEERTKYLESPRSPRDTGNQSGSFIFRADDNDASPHAIGLPLHAAIIKGHLETVKILMEHGNPKQIEEQNADGNTPVHLACASKNLQIFDAVVNPHEAQKGDARLIEHLRVARVRKNNHGYLPLHIVAQQGGRTSFLMAVRLLQTGDDIHAFTGDEEQNTPFSLAERSRESACEELDMRSMKSASNLMLLLAVYAPEFVEREAEHMAPRMIAKMLLNLRNTVSETMFNHQGDEDPLDVMLNSFINFYDEEEVESDSHRRRDKKKTKSKKKRKQKNRREPSFYGYGSDFDIRGQSS